MQGCIKCQEKQLEINQKDIRIGQLEDLLRRTSENADTVRKSYERQGNVRSFPFEFTNKSTQIPNRK